MDPQSLSQHHDSVITTTRSPTFLCGLQEMAKRITQLKKNGDNFNIWERQLKVTIRSLTGSTTYLSHEADQHDRQLDEVVFNLIFWSIDEDLQLDLKIDGSAKDAFRILTVQCNALPLNPQAECIASRHKIAGILQIEDIMQNIVDIVHEQSISEFNVIKERELARLEVHEPPTFSGKGPAYKVYYDHCGPPILNTFQNLAVVNRMSHRLCLPKLWQKIQLPSARPAPMSLWTNMLLSKYGEKVKSFGFELADSCLDRNSYNFMDIEKHKYDNTMLCAIPASPGWIKDVRYGIRSENVEKILKSCPNLESVSVIIPYHVAEGELARLGRVLEISPLPNLQALKLENRDHTRLLQADEFVISLLRGLKSLVSLELCRFGFRQEAIEESLGWTLAQQEKLRKIRFEQVTCEDGTWTLNAWLQRLETLELDSCPGLSTRALHGLLSGSQSAPSLIRLHLALGLGQSSDELDVNARFDLPVLKELTVDSLAAINLMFSFENCKDIELLKCGISLKNEQWELMKHHLSISTWPKLSVLSLSRAHGMIAKEEVDEIRDAYNIKLLID
ncbi:uncharacterized protein MELLADRAFT_84891 [Melampsora larici-populina 98AG31]|uniref:Uncharacterized protein n=1 Tax=Melampsora larici-populina (strain 98AG31 / pathotype 3-4-7) TaxID=747676 RepID=F4RH52_MELLP|nr:uncharacterized protein MELLADRAFT_84891 [Melampsora larici-populina 98AG31]EGG08393.1 hypothetical protein MELLADRAFT_84891 [Melampsora larici-populina 98AG31]